MNKNELGAFIRARREAVSPTEVGLAAGTRRRTPGLRRSELATLAGVSVEYLTRLEQGRDRNPSVPVLAALAETLRLSPDDRLLLLRLAKAARGDDLCDSNEPPALTVRPTVRTLLDRLEPTPAVLLNRLGDVVAFTSGYERLAAPLGLLDGDPPNLVRYLFTDRRAHDLYPEWERIADQHLAGIRIESCHTDPHVGRLAEELAVTVGAAFTDRLDAPLSFPERTGIETWAHPEAGELRLAYETLLMPDADDQRLMVYLPADDATATALESITYGRPDGLRLVTG